MEVLTSDCKEGNLQTLDLHLKPEVLHFGLNPRAGEGYEKVLRDNKGVEQSDPTIDVRLDANQILDVEELLSKIRAYRTNIAWPLKEADESSANLALQLLEGVERARFTAKLPLSRTLPGEIR